MESVKVDSDFSSKFSVLDDTFRVSSSTNHYQYSGREIRHINNSYSPDRRRAKSVVRQCDIRDPVSQCRSSSRPPSYVRRSPSRAPVSQYRSSSRPPSYVRRSPSRDHGWSRSKSVSRRDFLPEDTIRHQRRSTPEYRRTDARENDRHRTSTTTDYYRQRDERTSYSNRRHTEYEPRRSILRKSEYSLNRPDEPSIPKQLFVASNENNLGILIDNEYNVFDIEKKKNRQFVKFKTSWTLRMAVYPSTSSVGNMSSAKFTIHRYSASKSFIISILNKLLKGNLNQLYTTQQTSNVIEQKFGQVPGYETLKKELERLESCNMYDISFQRPQRRSSVCLFRPGCIKRHECVYCQLEALSNQVNIRKGIRATKETGTNEYKRDFLHSIINRVAASTNEIKSRDSIERSSSSSSSSSSSDEDTNHKRKKKKQSRGTRSRKSPVAVESKNKENDNADYKNDDGEKPTTEVNTGVTNIAIEDNADTLILHANEDIVSTGNIYKNKVLQETSSSSSSSSSSSDEESK